MIKKILSFIFKDYLILKKTKRASVYYNLDGVKYTAFKRIRNKFSPNKKKLLKK